MPIRRIYADIMELFDGAETLVLNVDASSGDSTLTVQSIIGAAINNILFIREPGSERAEIIATHAATAPAGNTVTLASTLIEAHPAGTKIYIIRADQVRFYRSATEDDANSDDSNLTALAAAQAIDPTLIRNFYDDTTQTSGYYYYRFQDSVNSVDLLYSDPIPWNQINVQFADDEVGYIIEFIRKKIGFEWNDRFSKQTAIGEINACLRYVAGKLKRWSKYLKADYAIGQTARGVFDFDLPTNIYDNETNKSILNVKLGGATRSLVPKDEKEFDSLMSDTKRTQVRTQTTAADTSVAVDNSYDFDDDGTIHIFTDNVDDTITYTGVTRSATAGVFTGISATGSGAVGATHAVDTNVWQDHEEGEPKYFNVRQGKMRVWPLPDSSWINRNIFADYYTEATVVDSESDTIDVGRFDMVKHFLLWQARNYLFNNGKSDLKDGDYIIFRDILNDAIRKEISGQKHKMMPKINTISYRSINKQPFDRS